MNKYERMQAYSHCTYVVWYNSDMIVKYHSVYHELIFEIQNNICVIIINDGYDFTGRAKELRRHDSQW
jgi:hypothetical protein